MTGRARGRARPRRGRLAGGVACLLLAAACGGEPNAVLSVTVGALPQRTADERVTLTGAVTRSPAKETPIVVAVAGGVATLVDTIGMNGQFSMAVDLNPNQENQLAVTASDGTGAVSEPTIIVVYHDDTGPEVSRITPGSRAENVRLDTPIEILFDEPLRVTSPGAALELFHNGGPVVGLAAISPDSMRLTFTPADPLLPGSVYEMRFAGFGDEIGNPAGTGTDACFMTTSDGFESRILADTGDVGWIFPRDDGSPPSASLTEPDLRRVHLLRSDSTLFGLIQFAATKTFGGGGNNNASVFVEIDADQNPTTGFTTIRDTVFVNFPEVASGMRAEYLIGLERNSELGDSAYVGVYTGPLEFEVLETFLPGVCGPYFGFHTAALLGEGGDDGNFDVSLLALAFEEAEDGGARIDIMPESGHLEVDLGTSPIPFPRYRADVARTRLVGVTATPRADVLRLVTPRRAGR